jgi:hypothetical protein
MNEDFELPVNYKGKELLLPARLLHLGYIYKIEVDCNEATISFERDDERNWRALADPEILEKNKPKPDLMQAIADSLDAICK